MTEILINIITATENILILCDNQYIKSSLIEKHCYTIKQLQIVPI